MDGVDRTGALPFMSGGKRLNSGADQLEERIPDPEAGLERTKDLLRCLLKVPKSKAGELKEKQKPKRE